MARPSAGGRCAAGSEKIIVAKPVSTSTVPQAANGGVTAGKAKHPGVVSQSPGVVADFASGTNAKPAVFCAVSPSSMRSAAMM